MVKLTNDEVWIAAIDYGYDGGLSILGVFSSDNFGKQCIEEYVERQKYPTALVLGEWQNDDGDWQASYGYNTVVVERWTLDVG